MNHMDPATASHHRDTEAQRDPVSETVLGAAIEVHRALGPGLLESVYEECLCRELDLIAVQYRRQVEQPITYKGAKLKIRLRIDLIVDHALVVEIKAVDTLLPVHQAQLLTYMRLAGLQTGLLINFNVPVLKHGIKRMKL